MQEDNAFGISKIDEGELAEFLGILAGDGYIRQDEKKSDYVIEVVGDKRFDIEYLTTHVVGLINSLFDILPKLYVRDDQNLAVLRINSLRIYTYLKTLGFPTGKKGEFSANSIVQEEFMLNFVQGLADTDFSLVLKRRSKTNLYPVITLKLINHVLVEELSEWLNLNGFRPVTLLRYTCKDKRGYNNCHISQIDLNGGDNLKRWMEIIGFRNNRQLKKYKKWESYKNGTSGI